MAAFGLADAVLGALTLSQITNGSLNHAAEVLAFRGSGNVDPSDHAITKMEPVASFTSTDVATILAANSSTFATAGLSVSSGTITIPYRVRSAGATYVSGANNTAVSATDGVIIPTSLTVSETSSAEINLECHFESTDGTTNPLSDSSTETVSTSSFNAAYRLATSSINGSNVSGISSYTVNFGINIESNVGLDGFLCPTEHHIYTRDPTIDVTFRDIAAFNTFSTYAAQSAAVFKLRKMSPGGTVVSDATAEHITVTFADGIINMQQLSASGTSRGEVSYRLYGESLTVSTTATL